MKLARKNVVVMGGSRGVGRAIVEETHAEGAKVLAVARHPEPLAVLADTIPGVQTLAIDASDADAPARVFEKVKPDLLVVCGGATPHTALLQEHSWEQFSRNWDNDVKAAFLFCKAALRLPLSRGSTVIIISSGAAIAGSPLSGGYAGAKRMQMFLAEYAQEASDRLNLGLRFIALAPMGIMQSTELGKHAIEGYSAHSGMSVQQYIDARGAVQTPDDVSKAVVELATTQRTNGSVFGVSLKGIEAIA